MAGALTVDTLNSSTGVLATQNGMSGVAKAWGSYAFVGIGSTPTLRGAFNISSITRNSTGNFTLAFTTAMPNVNYSFSGSATYPTGNEPSFCNAITKTTANVTMVNGYIGSNSLWGVYDYGLDFVIFSS
jgi:hypothetical protein